MFSAIYLMYVFISAVQSLGNDGTNHVLACGDEQPHHLTGSNGIITSPGYESGKYPPNIQCSWTIIAPEGQLVLLQFDDFDLQPAIPDCIDVLAVFSGIEPMEGELDPTRLEAVLCNRFLPSDFLSKGREIFLFFGTDGNMEYRGFKLRYSFTKPKEPCKGLTCRNGACVPLDKKCNRKDDCGDGTDEENCGYPLRPVTNCGIPRICPDLKEPEPSRNRIVGGTAARPGSWPWQVQLRLVYKEPVAHTCGATLLNEQFILTAAHCFKSLGENGDWTVYVGKYNRDTKNKEEQLRYMSEIHIHPGFEGPINGSAGSSNRKDHDIAVVRLNAPVRYGPWVSPVCLPGYAGAWAQLDTPPALCFVTGWGETQGTGHWDVLKQAALPLLSNRKCKSWYEGKWNITSNMLCAGYEKGSTDSCEGDSGGPLVTQYHHRWHLIGVVSFGDKCALPKKPGVYARVSNYEKWILRTIKKSMARTVKRWQRPY